MVASGRRRVWALGGRWWASGALPSAAWAAFGPVVTLAKAGEHIHYVFVCRYGLPGSSCREALRPASTSSGNLISVPVVARALTMPLVTRHPRVVRPPSGRRDT